MFNEKRLLLWSKHFAHVFSTPFYVNMSPMMLTNCVLKPPAQEHISGLINTYPPRMKFLMKAKSNFVSSPSSTFLNYLSAEAKTLH